MNNVPKLRFKEFSGEWEEKTLGDVSNKVLYGIGSSATAYDGTNKYLRITDIDESSRTFMPNPLTSPDGEIEDRYKLIKGDIVFARTGASTGKSYLYNEKDGNLIYAGFLIKFHINKANPCFVYANTFTEHYNKWVQVMSVRSGQQGINAEEYKRLPLLLPSKQEQEKIASFLTSVDTKIQQLTKKAKRLGQYKKGVMQKIFNGEIRFKADDGSEFADWEEIPLRKVLKERKLMATKAKRYEHVSLTTEGVVAKSVRYERNFLVVNDATKQYKVTRLNDICYNPANLKFGVIARNKYSDAIFSPIYVTFEVVNADIKFIEYFVTRWDFINKVRKYEEGTVYERQAVKPEYFLKFSIAFPCLKEQTKIANFLSSIDTKINLVQKQLNSTKEFKKALLQQMFV